MAKPKSLAKEADSVAELLQLLVRLKAADDNGYVSCVVCGVTRHYKDGMQGGHFISRGRSATKLIEENIHPECRGCNIPGSGHEAGYAKYMVETYGIEFVEWLHNESRKVKKWNREELAEMKGNVKEQIKTQLERVIG
jgi:hypothetical protein